MNTLIPLIRFTPEQIRSKAADHVGYNWSPRPGTHMSDHAWTEADTELYMHYYNEILQTTSRSINVNGKLP